MKLTNRNVIQRSVLLAALTVPGALVFYLANSHTPGKSSLDAHDSVSHNGQVLNRYQTGIPGLLVSSTSLNMGIYAPDAVIDSEITFWNIGDRTLTLQDIDTLCSCTNATFSVQQMEPNSIGSLRVSVDTSRVLEGRLQNQIALRFREAASPVAIKVTAEARETPVRVIPTTIGRVEQAQSDPTDASFGVRKLYVFCDEGLVAAMPHEIDFVPGKHVDITMTGPIIGRPAQTVVSVRFREHGNENNGRIRFVDSTGNLLAETIVRLR